MAKALCVALSLPLIGVHHLKGHIYSLFIESAPRFPMTVLLVSGGHTQVIEAASVDEMTCVASTMDDSFGESFDKVAKMMHRITSYNVCYTKLLRFRKNYTTKIIPSITSGTSSDLIREIRDYFFNL